MAPDKARAAVFATALVGLATALSLLTYRNGCTQFGGYDFSLLVDLAWRQYSGQRPFRDFVSTMPPFFALEARAAFSLLGPEWRSLVAVSAAQCFGVATLSGYYARRCGLPELVCLAAAAALAASLCTYYGFPWHGVEGAIAGSLLMLATVAWLKRRSAIDAVGIACCSAMLAFSKPNAIVFVLPAVWAALALDPRGRRPALLASAVGMTGAGALAYLGGFAPLALLASYRSVAGRAVSLDAIADLHLFDFSKQRLDGTWTALVMCTAWLISTLRHARAGDLAQKATGLVAAGALLGALYCALSNIESTVVAFALACAGLLAATALARDESAPSRSFPHLVALALALLAVGSLRRGLDRERVWAMGPYFWQDPARYSLLTARRGFFAGTELSEAVIQVLIEDRSARCAFGATAFYGPNLQWLYALNRQPSPGHVPIWWHPGSSHARSENEAYTRAELAAPYAFRLHMRGNYPYYDRTSLALLQRAHRVVPMGATEALVPLSRPLPSRTKIRDCTAQAVADIQGLFE